MDTVLLHLAELTEYAIKFLSGYLFGVTLSLAALKVGVLDYKDLVTRKVGTAKDSIVSR